MTEYFIDKISTSVTSFTSRRNHVFYLIEGESVAYVIDTAMEPTAIRPMLETWTDKPLVLLVTHMHCDHMYHADEFDTVYVPKKDLKAWGNLKKEAWFATLIFKEWPKNYDVSRYLAFEEEQAFDLDSTRRLEVIEAPGHSPGSSLFVYQAEKLIFVGDAFYANTWLWLPSSGSLSNYLQMIEGLLEKLSPYADYTFIGGHRPQQRLADQELNPLISYETLKDMKTLCLARLEGRISPVEKPRYGPFHLEIYRLGQAGLWLKKKTN